MIRGTEAITRHDYRRTRRLATQYAPTRPHTFDSDDFDSLISWRTRLSRRRVDVATMTAAQGRTRRVATRTPRTSGINGFNDGFRLFARCRHLGLCRRLERMRRRLRRCMQRLEPRRRRVRRHMQRLQRIRRRVRLQTTRPTRVDGARRKRQRRSGLSTVRAARATETRRTVRNPSDESDGNDEVR